MPDDVAGTCIKYSRERGLSLSDQWIDASTPSRSSVGQSRSRRRRQTDDPRWQSVSSHDLRRHGRPTISSSAGRRPVIDEASVDGHFSAIDPTLQSRPRHESGGHAGIEAELEGRNPARRNWTSSPPEFLYCFLIGIVCLIGRVDLDRVTVSVSGGSSIPIPGDAGCSRRSHRPAVCDVLDEQKLANLTGSKSGRNNLEGGQKAAPARCHRDCTGRANSGSDQPGADSRNRIRFSLSRRPSSTNQSEYSCNDFRTSWTN